MAEYAPTTAALEQLWVEEAESAATEETIFWIEEQAKQGFRGWLASHIAAAEKRGAEQAIRDAAERVKRSFTGEVHYERLQEHADMIRDDEVDWRKPVNQETSRPF